MRFHSNHLLKSIHSSHISNDSELCVCWSLGFTFWLFYCLCSDSWFLQGLFWKGFRVVYFVLTRTYIFLKKNKLPGYMLYMYIYCIQLDNQYFNPVIFLFYPQLFYPEQADRVPHHKRECSSWELWVSGSSVRWGVAWCCL